MTRSKKEDPSRFKYEIGLRVSFKAGNITTTGKITQRWLSDVPRYEILVSRGRVPGYWSVQEKSILKVLVDSSDTQDSVD